MLHALSQLQMSDRLNMSQSTYSRYENGQTHPTSSTILKVSEEFNVTTDWLLKDESQNLDAIFDSR